MRRRLGAAHVNEAAAFSLHFGVFRQPISHVVEQSSCWTVAGFNDSVVHPFSFPPRTDDSRLSQVSQVSGYLRLRRPQHFDE